MTPTQSDGAHRSAETSSKVTLWSTPGLADYATCLRHMEARVADIRSGADETVWLLEHPPTYTAGTSAKAEDFLGTHSFPVFETGRGGQFTYHGPGQRVAYLMFDLTKRGRDVRCFVHDVEQVVIDTLGTFGVAGERRNGRVGVWVDTPRGEEKIAAIGIRVRRWVTFHGLAINVAPDLSHFDGIVPCGLPGYGVTSLAALELPATMPDLDAALKGQIQHHFGCTLAENQALHIDEIKN